MTSEPKREEGMREIKTVSEIFNFVKNRVMQKLKHIKPQRRRDMVARALTFTKANRNVLIIIADPEKDDLIAGYNGLYSAARIKSSFLHRNVGVVKSLLERDPEDKNLERRTDEFLAFIDAFMFKYSENIKKVKERSEKEITNLNEKK